MNIGIVGLPNVGKSTLFKALTKKQVDIANYPFCTIDPNTGVVKVPDSRLDQLSALSKSEQIIPTSVEFVDIAGLVKGAHEGQGLGNKFLAHIREVDAIAHVVRVFRDKDIIHVDGDINPVSDIETINLELVFSDMVTIEKRIATLKSQLKSGQSKDVIAHLALAERVSAALHEGILAQSVDLSPEERVLIKDVNLLTLKPMMYVLNTDESRTIEPDIWAAVSSHIGNAPTVQLCAKIEADISELSAEEQSELGLQAMGLDVLIRQAYEVLSLITFFTTGPKETRAWTVRKGARAPQAAGEIHSDFEKGFIRAEVINWKDLIDVGGEVAAKEKGLVRLEGKEYVTQDGDVMVFRFSV